VNARALVLVAAATTGCGPSLRGLVADHHDREAICGAHDGSSGDRAEVGRALDGHAGLALEVYSVRPGELEPLLGDAAASFAGRARLVRVSAQTNIVPVDGLAVDVAIVGATPVRWDALAAVTGERLPARRWGTTYATPGNVLKGLGVLFSFGTVLLPSLVDRPIIQFRPGAIEVDAPDHEYRRIAPRAHALYHATVDASGCSALGSGGSTGVRCRWFFVVSPAASMARLDVAVTYSAQRVTGRYTPAEPCMVARRTSVELGPIDQLDRVFPANRMRPLAELVGRVGAAR